MNDMTSVIVPKSDQWNADDFIAGPRTFTIREVQIRGGQEQPVNILLEGSEKAYRPCKSMSRVLVQAWGPDSNTYPGRSMTLYRDPTVKWAGMEIGGIRISHLSHIDGVKQMMLTATKGSRKPHKVMPLATAAPAEPTEDKAATYADNLAAQIKLSGDAEILDALLAKETKGIAKLGRDRPELKAEIDRVEAERREWLTGDDDFGGEE